MESPAGSINAEGVVSSLRHFVIGFVATAVMIVAGVIQTSGGPDAIENLNTGFDWTPYLKALWVGLSAFAFRFITRWLPNIPGPIPGQATQGFFTLLKRIF
jgi:hypothetical protein